MEFNQMPNALHLWRVRHKAIIYASQVATLCTVSYPEPSFGRNGISIHIWLFEYKLGLIRSALFLLVIRSRLAVLLVHFYGIGPTWSTV
jgi:hypothetical protein